MKEYIFVHVVRDVCKMPTKMTEKATPFELIGLFLFIYYNCRTQGIHILKIPLNLNNYIEYTLMKL